MSHRRGPASLTPDQPGTAGRKRKHVTSDLHLQHRTQEEEEEEGLLSFTLHIKRLPPPPTSCPLSVVHLRLHANMCPSGLKDHEKPDRETCDGSLSLVFMLMGVCIHPEPLQSPPQEEGLSGTRTWSPLDFNKLPQQVHEEEKVFLSLI